MKKVFIFAPLVLFFLSPALVFAQHHEAGTIVGQVEPLAESEPEHTALKQFDSSMDYDYTTTGSSASYSDSSLSDSVIAQSQMPSQIQSQMSTTAGTTMQWVPVTTMQLVPVPTVQQAPVIQAPIVQAAPVIQAAPIVEQAPIIQAPAPQPQVIVVQAPAPPPQVVVVEAPAPAPVFFEMGPMFAAPPVMIPIFEVPVRRKKCCLFGCH